MKQSPFELDQEMKDLLINLQKIKGAHYGAIVENALNQSNLVLGWCLLSNRDMRDELKAMVMLNEGIISTSVAVMISLWKTSNFKPENKEEEEAMYKDCEETAVSILKDVKMLQAKQREYTRL